MYTGKYTQEGIPGCITGRIPTREAYPVYNRDNTHQGGIPGCITGVTYPPGRHTRVYNRVYTTQGGIPGC